MDERVKTDEYVRTERTRLRRLHERGSYKHDDVYAVLDQAPLCHVGYVIDGAPYVTPTMHWREGNRVYWHGSAASRFLRKAAGTQVNLTCSFMDGYVLARSAFYHSVRFRSAMVFGEAKVVEDDAEKLAALRHFIENLFPGRWDTLRAMQPQELKATSVLYLEITEATAKVRTGYPNDPEDVGHPVWAGVVPIESRIAAPEPAPDLMDGIAVPDYVERLLASGRLRT